MNLSTNWLTTSNTGQFSGKQSDELPSIELISQT